MSILDFLMDDETATSGLKDLKNSLKGSGGSNNVWYRYRNVLSNGQSCTLRFLPASEHNASGSFWLPKKIIRLKFADPVNVGQSVNLNIPVMQMYKGGKASDDPILGQVTRLYEEAKTLEDKGDAERAKQVRSVASYHYIKGEAFAQGYVNYGPPEKEAPPENLIRMFELNKSVINVMKAKIETENPSAMLDHWPCHGKKGHDFIIEKGRTGDDKYDKYDGGDTGFVMKSTPLTDAQWASLEKYGLWNLESFLPARPTDDEYALLALIVQQSIAGNRIWDHDWEDEFTTIKVYRNASKDASGEDASEFSDQIKTQMSRLTGTGKTTTSATSEGVLAALSRTNGAQEEDANETQDDESQDEPSEAEAITTPARNEARSIVDKIRQNQSKTKTATVNG